MADELRPSAEVASPQAAFGPTITIFFSDIRGFTDYTDAHGDADAYRMLQHHNMLVQEQLALYHGHVVKTLGDSYMVSFDSARNAVACAVGIQKQLAEYNGTQQGPKVEIGIGINTGEPIREGNDLFGGSVNLAARICAVAGSGRILVSETVQRVVGRMEGSDYIDRGSFEIKGFQDPQHLFEVDWSGAGAVRATQVQQPQRMGIAATTSGPVPPADSTSVRSDRPKGLLIGGAVAALVVVALVGAFVMTRGATQPALVGTPAGAAAPGRLLFSDDFADPTKGQFRDKLADTRRVTLPSGAVQFPLEAGYSDGGYLTRIKGPYPDNPQRVPFIANIDSSNRAQGDFAVEATIRAVKSAPQARYGLTCDLGSDNFLIFMMDANDGAYFASTGNAAGNNRRILTASRATSARTGNQDNLMRMEVRGEALRLFINAQELASPGQLPARSRDAALLGLRIAMLGPLADGDLEVRFDDYKVFALGQ